MPSRQNPFRPTFGVTPPVLAGRDQLIEEFEEALADGPGAPGRATLFTGARGAGKTVMLNAVEDRAREAGWVVVSETATPGFVGRLGRQHLPALLRTFDPEAVRRRLSGLTAPFNAGGLSWEIVERHVVEAGLRSQVELLSGLLAENGTGVLLTLDEIHRRQLDELRELATTVQHAFREEREVAFVGAGLGSAVSDLLNDDVLTFLRRAERHQLGPVERDEVERALREPILAGGRRVADDALAAMVEGARGYPFLIQLVGAQTWRLQPEQAEITLEQALRGVANARRRLGRLVHEPALAGVSEIDRAFLHAMAEDDGPSRMAEIAGRLNVTMSYAGQYRLRLIAAELIEPVRRGYVDFALPYLREYLREHDAEQGGAAGRLADPPT
jgi:hypothetical protein